MSRTRLLVSLLFLAALFAINLHDRVVDAADVLIDIACTVAVIVIVFLIARNRAVAKRGEISEQNLHVVGLVVSIKRLFAAVVQFFYPHTPCCGRCWFPIGVAHAHFTWIEDFFGQRRTALYPLCKPCFRELTPEERLPYYGRAFGELIAKSEILLGSPGARYIVRGGEVVNYEWEQLKNAVLVIEDDSTPEKEHPDVA